LLPGFVGAFLILAALNSFHLVPEAVAAPAATLSRALLVTAVAAVGMKTSLAKLADVGGTAIALLAVQTAVLAGLVLLCLTRETVGTACFIGAARKKTFRGSEFYVMRSKLRRLATF
jgi:hypothetical protein